MIKKDYGEIVFGPNCMDDEDTECDFIEHNESFGCYECKLARDYAFFSGDTDIKEIFDRGTSYSQFPKLAECVKRYPKGAEVEINITVEAKAVE